MCIRQLHEHIPFFKVVHVYACATRVRTVSRVHTPYLGHAWEEAGKSSHSRCPLEGDGPTKRRGILPFGAGVTLSTSPSSSRRNKPAVSITTKTN